MEGTEQVPQGAGAGAGDKKLFPEVLFINMQKSAKQQF